MGLLVKLAWKWILTLSTVRHLIDWFENPNIILSKTFAVWRNWLGVRLEKNPESLITADLNGVLEGSNKALCLRRAGPEAMDTSVWCVEMYLEGGPPKISSLLSNTCSQRCRVFITEWHNGEHTGRSKTQKHTPRHQQYPSEQQHITKPKICLEFNQSNSKEVMQQVDFMSTANWGIRISEEQHKTSRHLLRGQKWTPDHQIHMCFLNI